jgi:hypothetical protein
MSDSGEMPESESTERGEQIRLQLEPYQAESEAREHLHADLLRHPAVRAHSGGPEPAAGRI